MLGLPSSQGLHVVALQSKQLAKLSVTSGRVLSRQAARTGTFTTQTWNQVFVELSQAWQLRHLALHGPHLRATTSQADISCLVELKLLQDLRLNVQVVVDGLPAVAVGCKALQRLDLASVLVTLEQQEQGQQVEPPWQQPNGDEQQQGQGGQA